MKNIFAAITPRRLAFAAILSSVSLVSCSDTIDEVSTPATPPNPSITELVVGSANFSTLEDAVIKADLAATLNGTGPFTVFAPSNDAFAASGITPAVLASLSQAQARSILLYHALPGTITAANVPAGPNARVTTVSGDSVFVTRNSAGVFVNGIQVQAADISARNGVVHQIGRVLMPPAGNLLTVATAPANRLDSLVKAVTRAASAPGGDPALAAALTGGTLTVLAPSNAAFTQLLQALSLTDINSIPVATLVSVLRLHVIQGRVFSNQLAVGNVATLGGNISVAGTAPNFTLAGAGNGTNRANISITNIMATNGVVHVIDRVLRP